MAGLGETCTHVAALMFTLEAMVKMQKCTTVTQVPAYWKQPPFKDVAYVTAHDIDFRSAQKKHRDCNDSLTLIDSMHPEVNRNKRAVPEPTTAELNKFYSLISFENSKIKPAILSLVTGFNKEYETNVDQPSLPPLLDGLPLESLLALQVSEEQVQFAELKTRGQASSPLWHKLRKGRITASVLYDATHTDINKPSKTVVNSILQKRKTFSSLSTEWGKSKEKTAREIYERSEKTKHVGFQLRKSLLSIDNTHLWALRQME